MELVDVYHATTGAEAHLIRGLLEEAGLQAIVEGEALTTAIGDIPAGWTTAPRVMVASNDAERARTLIAERKSEAVDWTKVDPTWTSVETDDSTSTGMGTNEG